MSCCARVLGSLALYLSPCDGSSSHAVLFMLAHVSFLLLAYQRHGGMAWNGMGGSCVLSPSSARPDGNQTPPAPGASLSFFRASRISLIFFFVDPSPPPFCPFPLRSASLAIRSQLVPPAVVSSRFLMKSAA